MAKAISCLLLYILLASLLITSVLGKPINGLTMRLIHRDSPESPLYPGNLTYSQTIDLLVQRSKARAQYLSAISATNSSSNSITLETLRPKAGVQANPHGMYSHFMVEVGIGSFSNRSPKYIPYFLLFDTGSDLIWTQCEDCRKPGHSCYNQSQPIFPNSASSTYQLIPSRPPKVLTYKDGSSVTIVTSREKFTFGSSSGSAGSVETNTLVFGCAIDQTHMQFGGTGTNMIAGIMGSAWGESSLISQLRPYGLFRFSYCIPQVVGSAPAPTTFLRFGSDIPARPGLSATSLVGYGNLNPYFLNLIDMSLGVRRLGMPANVFVRDESKHNHGTVIDTGSEVSHIISPAFDVLKRALVNHFTRLGSGFSVIPSQQGLEVCFSGPASIGFDSLPSITFVFREGSGLVVKPRSLYVLGDLGGGRKYVCLAMLRAADITIIGAYQQINQRIIYDTQAKKLYFGPEICRA